jgi:hypothetical protein
MKEVLYEHGLDVPVVERDELLFVGGVRNIGIATTRAPFVAFLASDCMASPGWAAKRLKAHGAGQAAVASSVGNSHPRNPFAWAGHLCAWSRRMPGSRYGIPYGASYDRNLFRTYGLFREDLRTGEDTEFHERLPRRLKPQWNGAVRTIHRNPTGPFGLISDQFHRGARRARARQERGKAPLPSGPRAWWKQTRRVIATIRDIEPEDRGAALLAVPIIPFAMAAKFIGMKYWRYRYGSPREGDLEQRIRELERLLGLKTAETERLREALAAEAGSAHIEPAKETPRPPVAQTPTPSSITDSDELRLFWRLAATDAAVFAHFRRHPLTRGITELDFRTGCEYVESLLRIAPHYREAVYEFARNDAVGSPILYEFPELGRLSSATVRHIKFLADLESLFGPLDDLNIVEIGGGWGGQCRLIKSRFKPASYTIFDLHEMSMLAGRYLSELGVDDVSFRQPHEEPPHESADLVISNYAISEMPRSGQDHYLAKVISPAARGYILYNAARLSGLILRHTGEAPYTAAEFAGRIGAATTDPQWPRLVARDRERRNTLIHWGSIRLTASGSRSTRADDCRSSSERSRA